MDQKTLLKPYKNFVKTLLFENPFINRFVPLPEGLVLDAPLEIVSGPLQIWSRQSLTTSESFWESCVVLGTRPDCHLSQEIRGCGPLPARIDPYCPLPWGAVGVALAPR